MTPELKWDLGSWRLQPFVWTGVGLAYQATYPGPVSTATVVIPVGLGLQWNLDSRSRLFVQASYDILWGAPNTFWGRWAQNDRFFLSVKTYF